MINLLPPEQKKEIRAARVNHVLIRYIALLVGALVFLGGSLGVTYIFLDTSARNAEAVKAENEARTTGYAQTQAQAAALRNDLSQAKQLFDEELRYSQALLRISQHLPAGTALESLELTPETFSQATSLSVLITGESAAKALRDSFSGSQYFTNVSLGRLTINNDNATYPYTVELNLTMDRSIAQ